MIRFGDITIDRPSLTISVGYRAHRFIRRGPNLYRNGDSVSFESTVFMLLKGWASKTDLFSHVYGANAEGGPEEGPHIFDIHFCHWKNYHWRKLGLRLMRDKRGGILHFSLRKANV